MHYALKFENNTKKKQQQIIYLFTMRSNKQRNQTTIPFKQISNKSLEKMFAKKLIATYSY